MLRILCEDICCSFEPLEPEGLDLIWDQDDVFLSGRPSWHLECNQKHFGHPDGHMGFLAIKYKFPSGKVSGRVPKAEAFSARRLVCFKT